MEKTLEQLLEHFGYAGPFMYAAAAYGFFHWLDENASDEAKAALARTMRFKDNSEQVASALVEVFDRIYTHPLLCWRAFFRSLLYSTVISVIWLYENEIAIFKLAREAFAAAIWGESANWEEDIMYAVSLANYFVALLFNAFTDYLSLFVIRPLLIRSGTKPVIGLSLGALSGAAIVITGNELRWVAMSCSTQLLQAATFADTYDVCIRYFLTASTIVNLAMPTGFVLPALLVFAWLPFLALGIMATRLLSPLSRIIGRAQWFLKEGNEHPLKAVGYIAAIAVFFGIIAGRAVFSP